MADLKRSVRVWRDAELYRGVFDAMGSPCEILLDSNDESVARQATERAAAEAWRVEDKFSRYRADTIVSRINSAQGQAVEVDEETANLIDFATQLYELSNQRFDITSGVLRRAWTFDGSTAVPSRKKIRQILGLVGWYRADWQRPRLRLEPGMQVDFGGIGKEYAVDRVAAELSALDAAVLVNFGGDIATAGQRRRAEGWRVGIESVDDADAAASRLRLTQGALATSGDARRFVLRDGIRHGHILDPRSGWPVMGAPRSITVAADTCTQAGMLSTLAMLEGANAEAFLEQQDVRYWTLRDTFKADNAG